MRKVATYRKSPNPKFGYIIQVLGLDYRQEGTEADAQQSVDAINAKCDGLTVNQIRELYKVNA